MKFYIGKKLGRNRLERPKTPQGVACFLLLKDNWNDYGAYSLFELELRDSDGVIHNIGTLKIIQKDRPDTTLPGPFEHLPDEYISLGQDLEFYSELLGACGFEIAVSALEALNDISWAPDLSIPFETTSSFRNSLLRSSSTDEARRHGRSIINGESIPESFSFEYAGKIPGAEATTKIEVAFEPNDAIPGRIVGIIGRNAVGKTQFLAQLANDLAHSRRTSKETFDERISRFGGLRPSYNRVLAISYSAFDRFPRPKATNISYVYCGIRDNDGRASKSYLLEKYRQGLERIKEHGREQLWVEAMLKILGSENGQLEVLLSREIQSDGGDVRDEELSILSSGQAILANFITSMLAWIETKTLVLFDEPEMHLHPNAVASLFHVFSKLLEKFDSYALIATHSPLVVQELPSSRVIVFSREGNLTEATRLPSETFGENLSDLMRHIFETYEIPSHYKKVLRQISQKDSYDAALKRFPYGLSMNARSYLLSCYNEDSGETDQR